MESFLVLGFLIGMAHALEADHLAAVGTLATSGKHSPRRMFSLGASWGLGHTVTLFVMCAAVVLFGYVLTERMSAGLELTVGVMLVLLGLHVFWKIIRARVHFHVHSHEDGKAHIHAHQHAGDKAAHAADPHEHRHDFSLRACVVGLVHGLAGSGALIVLVASTTQSIWVSLIYVLLFGFGSVLGMALLTYAVSWPLQLGALSVGRAFRAIQIAVAFGAIYVGYGVITESYSVLTAA